MKSLLKDEIEVGIDYGIIPVEFWWTIKNYFGISILCVGTFPTAKLAENNFKKVAKLNGWKKWRIVKCPKNS